MSKQDGGPAFPVSDPIDSLVVEGDGHAPTGMSLRDWFAGQALAGMLASPPIVDRSPENVNHEGWARNAYAFADAMLAERAKRGGK